MAVFSDRDIRGAMGDGRIAIEPPIDDEQVQPGSLDVRMGENLLDVGAGVERRPIGGTHEIVPGRLYLADTLDDVTLANDITAQMAGRSSFGREGLVVHLTAGWVDPGWSGRLTMEMVNFGPEPIHVDVGERVAQLVFEETKSRSTGYDGKYAGADGPESSKRGER